ncbi:hypothetical protein OG613_47435 (plasmid) [Streptomyces sp. NBC_00015]|uniref:hypothetical protein n=1 Tax=Streptomyces sp. NBC_00015 TaxID=2903611 RepID=UPI002F907F70
MRFLITDDSRRILTSIEVPDAPDGEAVTIGIEHADRPDLLYVGADLYADGTVSVGHWPDGEDWVNILRTGGVPDPFGLATPARPAEPTYTRAHLTQALAAARAQMTTSTTDTAALDVFTQAALESLPKQAD